MMACQFRRLHTRHSAVIHSGRRNISENAGAGHSEWNAFMNSQAADAVSHALPHTGHAPGFRLRRGQNWVFLGLTYASYFLCRYNLGIVSDELKTDLKLDNERYGEIQSARDWAYAFGQFVNGLFTDRLGGKLGMTIGALGTVMLNVMFGIVCMSQITWMVGALILIRLLDGYIQAFGAPGMVKINTAWFRRKERGGFAGIFGGMIQLGAIGVGILGKFLTTGMLVIPLYFYAITITAPKLNWHYMFFVPPGIVLVIILFMNLFVKNHPEEAGFRILHEDEAADDDPHERIHLAEIFRTIASNPIVWVVASAYFCTGFVRKAIEAWWVLYLKGVWGADKTSTAYLVLVFALPLTAFIGSYGSGIFSDKLMKGRRASTGAMLYLGQTLFTLGAMAIGGSMGLAVALVLVIGINMTCNSTHSLLGTAAPMDLGGRKMAGFALGVIDSFQYVAAGLAGKYLGRLLDAYSGAATAIGVSGAAKSASAFNANVWFMTMLPFGVLGTILMVYLWWRHRGTDARGA